MVVLLVSQTSALQITLCLDSQETPHVQGNNRIRCGVRGFISFLIHSRRVLTDIKLTFLSYPCHFLVSHTRNITTRILRTQVRTSDRTDREQSRSDHRWMSLDGCSSLYSLGMAHKSSSANIRGSQWILFLRHVSSSYRSHECRSGCISRLPSHRKSW